jgi:hypothetical protein
MCKTFFNSPILFRYYILFINLSLYFTKKNSAQRHCFFRTGFIICMCHYAQFLERDEKNGKCGSLK